MKNKGPFILIVFIAAILAGGSIHIVRRSPVSVFVLRGVENSIEAFKLQIYFDQQDPTVEGVQLGPNQEGQAAEILKTKDLKGLKAFSNGFGKFSFVVGLPTLEEGWPTYLGGGLKGVFQPDLLGTFDDLQVTDHFYLSLATRIPPPPPATVLETQAPAPVKTPTVPTRATPSLVPTSSPAAATGSVRVEILNGCGITSAAEWVARRLKGPGIVIVGTDNADNFHYPKTIVQSAAGSPVALEDALERLGVPRETIVEISNPPGGVDVVVIVGKDFRKLKGKARGRLHH